MNSGGSKEWLERALLDLCRNRGTGLDLDSEIIAGLVSYCEFASPQDAQEKKRSGKAISLAEAAKGSVVFQQGKPCSCQARRHRLVSNCLSCGKVVCEQEGEGPCSFCGALVLREGSTYAGLEGTVIPLSDAEAAAEAFAKTLVEYDRNATARTTVIDDQSDYYETDGNTWLSSEEKQLFRKQQQEIEEAERARKSKIRVTFDLLGRKVLLNEDEFEGKELDYGVLTSQEEREANRITPNPTAKFQPVFVDPGRTRMPTKERETMRWSSGLCLEISGRVQHYPNEIAGVLADGLEDPTAGDHFGRSTLVSGSSCAGDDYE